MNSIHPATDLSALLQPISPAAPCGEDLEYDPEFLELEGCARGGSQHSVVDSGDVHNGPDWKEIRARAHALLGRTKDLRVVLLAITAGLRLQGIAGFGAGLGALRGLLAGYWDEVHPRIDLDQDSDTTLRINILRELCDRDQVLGPLREAPLVHAPGLGSFGLRDIALASGEQVATQPDAAAPDKTSIAAAFEHCDLQQLRQTSEALRRMELDIAEIERLVSEKVQNGQLLSLEPLAQLVSRMRSELDARAGQRLLAPTADTPATSAASDVFARTGALSTQASLAVDSRADVIRTLERLCEYYVRNEPSSPVPMLLLRAKRLVPMSFFDIVRELAPSGVNDIETLRGPQEFDN